MMRGMKKLMVFITFVFAVSFISLGCSSVGAYVDEDGATDSIYDFVHNLKYTDETKSVITGTMSMVPNTPVSYTFTKYRIEDHSAESMSGYIVTWFRLDNSGSLEIKRIDSNNGAVNHTLIWLLNDPVTYDILVKDYLGNDEDTSDGYTPGAAAPAPAPSGAAPTAAEEPLYALSNSGVTYEIDNDTGWHTVFGPDNVTTYDEWLKLVWNWAIAIMVPLSVLILSAAGVLYTISEGDSNRIGLAKKLIIGVVSGVGLLVLSRVLIAVILGTEGATEWFIFFTP